MSTHENALSPNEVELPRWRPLVARGLETLIGGILLIAGLLKAWEPLTFIKQITDYKIISQPGVVKVVAWTMIAIECGLGAALIVGFRRRIAIPIGVGLFVFFLCAIGWAWATGATEDCGCFGSWAKRTPAEAFAEDFLMMSALVAAGFLYQREILTYRSLRLGAVALSAVIGLSVMGWASQKPQQSTDPNVRAKAQTESPFSNVEVTLAQVDLTKGEHLVVLMDTGCVHCQAAVPAFNQLMVQSKNSPPVVALCTNFEEEVKAFNKKYEPGYPVGIIARPDFMKLLDGGGTPHTLLVRDGAVLHVWDGDIPQVGELWQLLPDSRR